MGERLQEGLKSVAVETGCWTAAPGDVSEPASSREGRAEEIAQLENEVSCQYFSTGAR